MQKLQVDIDLHFCLEHLTAISLTIDKERFFYAEFCDKPFSSLPSSVLSELRFKDKITASCGSWERWLSDTGKYNNALAMALAEKNMLKFVCIGKTPMVANRLQKWLDQFPEVTFNYTGSYWEAERCCETNRDIFEIIREKHIPPTSFDQFSAPFRVGRRQNRAVLDANGKEVVIFPKGLEELAEDYCIYLNGKTNNNTSKIS